MSLRAFFVSLLIVVVLLLVVAGVTIGFGLYNFAADAPHTALAKSVIALARERAIDVRTASIQVPPLGDAHKIREGARHYAAMCTACHLAPGMRENEMRPGLNPQPPALASIPPEEPAEQFWIVKHGLKMSGMPAWGLTHSDAEIWSIIAFLQKLPSTSPQQYRAMIQGTQTEHEHMH